MTELALLVLYAFAPPAALEESPATTSEFDEVTEEAASKVTSSGSHLSEEKLTDVPMSFLKGELTQLGRARLLDEGNFAGVRLGFSNVADAYFLEVRPGARLSLFDDQLKLELAAPLRFELFDLSRLQDRGDVFARLGEFRFADWQRLSDFLKPIRRVTWGRKEDHLYIDLNRSPVMTLGHGQLMRRYGPADLARDDLFASADAYFDLGGVELVAGALPIPRVVGGLAFIKPLGFIDQTQARSLSIGFTYAADLNAPDVLDTSPNFADNRPQFLVADDDELERANRAAILGHIVQGFGVDAELKVLKNDNVDIKTYLDWTALAFPGGSPLGEAFVASGYTAGALFRMNFGQQMLVDGHAVWEMPTRDEDRVDDEVDIAMPEITFVPEHALRLRVEARTFEGGFKPSYFDSFYEHERLQMSEQNTPLAARHQLPTRWASLAATQDDPWRVGGYLEASYLSPGNLAVTVAYEDAVDLSGQRVSDASNLSLHVETHQLDGFQFFATYHYRRFDDLTNLLRFNSDSEFVYLGASLRPFPIMNISFVTQRSFRVGFGPDDLARQRYVVEGKEGAFRRTTAGLLSGWTSDLRIDLGWHW